MQGLQPGGSCASWRWPCAVFDSFRHVLWSLLSHLSGKPGQHLTEVLDVLAKPGGPCIPQAPIFALKFLGQLVQLLQMLCQNGVLCTSTQCHALLPWRCRVKKHDVMSALEAP